MKLILIRHGKTLFNEMNMAQGWCDSPLTQAGIRQAMETGNLIAQMQIDEAYSSTSERAYDTAVYALNGRKIPVRMDKRLKELHFGTLEGVNNVIKNSLVARQDFMTRSFKAFGGESTEEMLTRELDFLHELEERDCGQTVLIGGHGVSLSALATHLAIDSIHEKYPDFYFMGNGCAIILEYKDGKYSLVEILGSYINQESYMNA